MPFSPARSTSVSRALQPLAVHGAAAVHQPRSMPVGKDPDAVDALVFEVLKVAIDQVRGRPV